MVIDTGSSFPLTKQAGPRDCQHVHSSRRKQQYMLHQNPYDHEGTDKQNPPHTRYWIIIVHSTSTGVRIAGNFIHITL